MLTDAVDLDKRWGTEVELLKAGAPIGRFDTVKELAERWRWLDRLGFYSDADPVEYLEQGIQNGVLSYVVDRYGIWAYRIHQGPAS